MKFVAGSTGRTVSRRQTLARLSNFIGRVGNNLTQIAYPRCLSFAGARNRDGFYLKFNRGNQYRRDGMPDSDAV